MLVNRRRCRSREPRVSGAVPGGEVLRDRAHRLRPRVQLRCRPVPFPVWMRGLSAALRARSYHSQNRLGSPMRTLLTRMMTSGFRVQGSGFRGVKDDSAQRKAGQPTMFRGEAESRRGIAGGAGWVRDYGSRSSICGRAFIAWTTRSSTHVAQRAAWMAFSGTIPCFKADGWTFTLRPMPRGSPRNEICLLVLRGRQGRRSRLR